ncbi:TPA: hypothetical protein KDY48_002603 [Vibrio parahaemolyticus]|uniref:methyl-accepting chemotaxis protein n=1 Tax=Vibrio rotiferianus TaxID=190895 RepID=UPI001110D067|nr:hypothetical protein DA097_03115 [Vibrio rotiferianus]HAS6498866.1 hypothetical protein [Vibrio parahaemolyticus]HAS6516744.1 hypothetical protein [Vibrio parahaemolyticus]HBC3374436.1 hypothetical protein [Vibrio parahaemolyticus]HBC3382353.1 hypothetical protein [Vibrio parahaemolyticus]
MWQPDTDYSALYFAKLAHRTQTSTDDIEVIISDMNQGTFRAVDSMNKSKQSAYSTMTLSKDAEQALLSISESMSLINERNHSIATASEEQSNQLIKSIAI